MSIIATRNTQPASALVAVTELEPFDQIAGPHQPDGPWLTVAVIPTGDFRSIVVIDDQGCEHHVAMQPHWQVRRQV